MKLYGQDMSRLELERRMGDLTALAGVRSVVLGDGAERGIRALQFRTGGGLSFEVLVDRAMDIGRVEFDDQTIAWSSATGFRHPGLHDYSDESGLSWLRSMSGLLVTAGLDHTLFGGVVSADEYRYPPKPTTRHGLHGRVANIPARLEGYGESWTEDRCVLWAEGEVRQAAVFGEHLRMRRRIEADMGGTGIRLIDRVTNCGFDSTPHMFLYHVNVGWPLLDTGSRFEADIRKTVWQSESVAEQGASAVLMPGPQPNFIEQVYEHAIRPDEQDRARARVVNDRLGRYFELEWDHLVLPHFMQWLNLREGSYAVGLEPSTHHVTGDAAARAEGTMIWLGHGEERVYRTSFHFGRT